MRGPRLSAAAVSGLILLFSAFCPLFALDKCRNVTLDNPKAIPVTDCDPDLAALIVDFDTQRWCQTEVCSLKDCVLGECNRNSPPSLVGACCKDSDDCRDESSRGGKGGKCVAVLGFIGCRQGEGSKKLLCNAGEPSYVGNVITCTSVADRNCDGGRLYTCTARIDECRCACRAITRQ